MSSPKVGSPLHRCSVCSASERMFENFGAITCSPCAAFFRRTVALKIRYVCKYNNCCSVAREVRNGCRSCRFQKCETAGMKKRSVQSKGENPEKLPEYIRRGRENGSEEVVRGFATSIFFGYSESKPESECVSPAASTNSSLSSICPILDVTPKELLNYYIEYVKRSIDNRDDALDFGSIEDFKQAKFIGDQNAMDLCSNCPGVDLLTEDEIATLLRNGSFSNVWLDSAWRRTVEGQMNESVARMESCDIEDPCESLRTLVSHFRATVSKAVSNLQLDLVEYSTLKAMCIWKLGLVDFTLTLKILAQEQYYGLTVALASYYRTKKNMTEMDIAVRLADITLLLRPIFESYCAAMRFYDGFSASR